MNVGLRHRDELQDLGAQRLPTQPLEVCEAPLVNRGGGVIAGRVIVRYRPLVARIQLRRQQRRARARSIRVRIRTDHRVQMDSIPEHRVRMPHCLQMLMNHGRPVGVRAMKCATTGEPYFKFSGVTQSTIDAVAVYLLSMPEKHRKHILERLMLTCQGWVMGKITGAYQDAATLVQKKNLIKIFRNHAIVGDEAGCLH